VLCPTLAFWRRSSATTLVCLMLCLSSWGLASNHELNPLKSWAKVNLSSFKLFPSVIWSQRHRSNWHRGCVVNSQLCFFPPTPLFLFLMLSNDERTIAEWRTLRFCFPMLSSDWFTCRHGHIGCSKWHSSRVDQQDHMILSKALAILCNIKSAALQHPPFLAVQFLTSPLPSNSNLSKLNH
jgi:hypothetical protein